VALAGQGRRYGGGGGVPQKLFPIHCHNPKCGVLFHTTKMRINKSKHVYCSPDCNSEAKKYMREGGVIAERVKLPTTPHGLRNITDKSHWVTKDYICEYCGGEFSKQVASEHTHKKYCKRTCANYASKYKDTDRRPTPRDIDRPKERRKYKAKPKDMSQYTDYKVVPKPSDQPKEKKTEFHCKGKEPNPNKLSRQKAIPTIARNPDDFITIPHHTIAKAWRQIRKDSPEGRAILAERAKLTA